MFYIHCPEFIFSDEVLDPVYENPPPKYSAKRVLKILLDPSLPASRICSTRPMQISRSSTYVVDMSSLDHPDDVKKDNFGVWVHSGSHPQAYKVHTEEDGFMTVEKCGASATGDGIVYLRRLQCSSIKQPVQVHDCISLRLVFIHKAKGCCHGPYVYAAILVLAGSYFVYDCSETLTVYINMVLLSS